MMDKKEEYALTRKYLSETNNNLFPIIYPALLWRHEAWEEMAPAAVWEKAIAFSDKLRDVRVPKIEVPLALDVLREDMQAEKQGTLLVLFASLFRLAPVAMRELRVAEAIGLILKSFTLEERMIFKGLMQRVAPQELKAKQPGNALSQYRINTDTYEIQQEKPTGDIMKLNEPSDIEHLLEYLKKIFKDRTSITININKLIDQLVCDNSGEVNH